MKYNPEQFCPRKQQQFSDPTAVSLHFNQAGRSINDVILISLELIRSNRDAVRKAREAHYLP